MAQIGRKIYYDLATGNVLVDTGEKAGNVVETTEEQDFLAYTGLQGRTSESVGCLQLVYGQYAEDFALMQGVRVDITANPPTLQFEYGPPQDPPVYEPPLADQVKSLQAANAALEEENVNTMLAITEVYEMILGGGA